MIGVWFLMRQFNKLVRDNIPERIKGHGETPVTRVLSHDEYVEALKAKLLEELQEFLEGDTEDGIIEELADVYEVLEAMQNALGFKDADVKAAKDAKAKTHGKFQKRIFLESVL